MPGAMPVTFGPLGAEVADLRKQLKGPRMSPPVAPPAAWEMEERVIAMHGGLGKLWKNGIYPLVN